MAALKPNLHLGSNRILGSNWHNVDGSSTVFTNYVFQQYGWQDRDGNWKISLGRNNKLRRAITLTVLLFERTFRPGKWPLQIHDLRKPLPFADETFEAAYTSHTIEHLYFEQALNLLEEIYRVLAPGGILRVVVPDLRSMVKEYFEMLSSGDTTGSAAQELNHRLLFREPHGPRGNFWQRIRVLRIELDTHKWMYDIDSLSMIVEQTGFVNVKQCGYLQSEIPVIGEVEIANRIEEGEGICVEAKKPKRERSWARLCT